MTFDERLDRELLRGVLPLCVLAVVAAHGPTYGYAITRSLADAGLGTVKGGTLYPLLQRLEDDGLVTTSWHQGERGPSRRYYAVTDQGRVALAAATSRWDAVTTAATTLVAGASGAPSPEGAILTDAPLPTPPRQGPPMSDTTRYTIERRHAPHVDPRWAEALLLELRLQGVAGARIGAVLAEVDAHVVDSGETAQEAFGDPVAYARSLDLPEDPAQSSSSIGRTVAASAVQTVGMLGVLWTLRPALDGAALVVPAGMLLVLVAALAGSSGCGAPATGCCVPRSPTPC